MEIVRGEWAKAGSEKIQQGERHFPHPGITPLPKPHLRHDKPVVRISENLKHSSQHLNRPRKTSAATAEKWHYIDKSLNAGR